MDEAHIKQIARPDPALLRHYVIGAILANVAFPIVMLPLYFKYHTLRYKFDDEGLSMSWGLLFRREIYVAYARIQDIHVTRGLIQRWLGIATIDVQTASGSALAEMSIVGLKEYEAVRDFLYSKMRGAKGMHEPAAGAAPDDALALLTEIRDAMKAVVAKLESR